MSSSVVNDVDGDRGLSPDILNILRNILISSLPRENSPFLTTSNVTYRRKIKFKENRFKTIKKRHLSAGGETEHEINVQLPNANTQNNGWGADAHNNDWGSDAQNSNWPANDKSHTDYRTKENHLLPQSIREERHRLFKEKQNEDRQKKLEELKQQAEAALKFREKTEEERRKRIEVLRNRENDRRQQVEERKRMIAVAERERKVAILRRNQEREARIVSKRKNERSSIVFAFGSSTPRMLESTYCGPRRATSTTNVMSMGIAPLGSLTRRSSERELANGHQQRATSAGGLLDRKSVDGSSSGETIPQPPSVLNQQSSSSNTVVVPARPRSSTAPTRKPRPISIAVTGVTSSTDIIKGSGDVKSPLGENRPPVHKVHVTRTSTFKIDAGRKTGKTKSSKSFINTTPKETPLQSPTIELSTEGFFSGSETGDRMTVSMLKAVEVTGVGDLCSNVIMTNSFIEQKSGDSTSSDGVSDLAECDMIGSMTSSQIRRITTEEEAKAALAERRKLVREQAEREAELEQQRLEAERLAEEERLRIEEEEQHQIEEEQLRLLEEAKRAEEERLLQAIEEAKKRDEKERQRKEEEWKLKLEKEEAEKKAKEEAEKQRQEMELKLKKEEEERQVRRKRVEAIMSRTRMKGGTPSGSPTKENNGDIEDNLNGVNNKVISDNSNGQDESNKFLIAERNNSRNTSGMLNPKQNGVHCAVESRNVTNTLLDLTDFDVINTNMISDPGVPPQILGLPVGKDNYNSNKQDIKDLLS